MKNWISDLRDRLFVNYQSTITGLVLLVFTWASDHGIDVSQDNQKVATAKILAVALSLFKLFGKDAPAPPMEEPRTGSGGTFGLGGPGRPLALVLLMLIPFSMVGCEDNRTAKHKLAVYTAQADASLVGFTDSVDYLRTVGKMKSATAKTVYQINQKAVTAVDLIRDRSETGFDKKEALTIVKNLLEDVRKAESEGLLGLQPDAQKKFREVTFFAIFTIQSIEAVIQAVKEPQLPKDIEIGEVSFSAQANEGQWTELVLILQTAVLRGISQSRMDQAAALADGRELSAGLKVSLAAKIAAIP